MLRFLKGLIIITILAVIVLPGMKYFLSSKITLMVNQWIANISPYARISYEKIDIDLGGIITLRNASIDIQHDQQPNFEVQRILIRFPEWHRLFLLAMKGEHSSPLTPLLWKCREWIYFSWKVNTSSGTLPQEMIYSAHRYPQPAGRTFYLALNSSVQWGISPKPL
ncbi:hypothetical protein [Endozoicomonas sp.]|uniref:hypothetical protein n=1 Tax=Endozoicomonas sp. TaxID=1892382 RepID=UPI002885839D|nr:hypothetical protein [Endozoicomonas sp.]